MTAFQDLGSVRHCFGCGADNPHGLQIKSYWDGEDAVCTWQPEPYHCAGRTDIVYGGILASVLDCHSVNLAIAHAYKKEERPIGSAPRIFYVTAQLTVSYLLPTPMGEPLALRAKLKKVEGRKTWVESALSAAGQVRVKAEVLAIRVYPDERQAAG
ncbi:MAG TPA: PaaI family thioesterase [Candidatus Acidoferrales bacterium]|nr:PaaI family thioesterase [Candidatus Acidoferrales bacterium]